MAAMDDPEVWAKVDRYFADVLLPDDSMFGAFLAEAAEAGLPPINVSPTEGMLLHVLVRAQQARAVLEIGTLAGYSTLWMARALEPGSRLVTLEIDPHHAEVAQRNFERAGLQDVVELRLGRALDSLERLEKEAAAPFDFVFIDADKQGYPDYLEWAIRLSRRGALILTDNVVREGRVADAQVDDAGVAATREFLERLGHDERLVSSAIQTVGARGYDGFALSLVVG